MRIVLFDDETMEPLTVLSVPGWAADMMKDGCVYRAPVMEPISMYEYDPRGVKPAKFRTVSIRLERFIRREQEHWFAFTKDAETSLLLRSVFLPGQQREVSYREKEAFSKGLITGMFS